jgi:hypothetical protein
VGVSTDDILATYTVYGDDDGVYQTIETALTAILGQEDAR